MKLLFVCLLAFLHLSVDENDAVIYSLQGLEKENGNSCYLVFSDEKYVIALDPNVEHENVILPSGGLYEQSGKSIILKDKLNGFNMELTRKGKNELVFKTGLPFLKGKRFKKVQSSWLGEKDVERYQPDGTPTELAAKRTAYNEEFSQPIALNYGDYIPKGYDLLRITLTLSQDNTYRMEFRRTVCSEGDFTRDGNILVLHDRCLDFPFYFLIEEGRKLDGCGEPFENLTLYQKKK